MPNLVIPRIPVPFAEISIVSRSPSSAPWEAFWEKASTTKIEYIQNKVGALILTSLLEDLAVLPFTEMSILVCSHCWGVYHWDMFVFPGGLSKWRSWIAGWG